MLIHSVAPLSALTYPTDGLNTTTVNYKRGYLQGVNSTDGFIVSRLISTDPKDYLDKNVYPGACIKL